MPHFTASRAALAALLLATPAAAEGFAITDLSALTIAPDILPGHTSISRVEPARATIMCTDCGDGLTAIDVLQGRQTDGTEARFRSGETTPAMLEAQCKARAPECTLSRIDVGPATGWITTYDSGGGAGSTVVLLRDGDMLTIRSLAADAKTAQANARTVTDALAPAIVGQ